MFFDKRFDHFQINRLSTVVVGQHQPNQEPEFERIVKRDPINDSVCERFDEGKPGVDHPVNKPSRVVCFDF